MRIIFASFYASGWRQFVQNEKATEPERNSRDETKLSSTNSSARSKNRDNRFPQHY
jgi:hypothetical protein